MPIYEYVCQSCGHEFELLVMGREKPACPECEGTKLEKRFSTFAPGAGRDGSAPPAFPVGGG